MAIPLLMLVTGCAHQIEINPNSQNITKIKKKSSKVAGYFISKEDKQIKVTTPGGGGDKITYMPYRDIEAAFYSVLSDKYQNVFLIDAISNTAFIKDKNISIIFEPKIVTTSSSSSPFTWPATNFTVKLTTKVYDKNSNLIWEKTTDSEGVAEFDEFKSDFSLSSRRAVEKSLNQLIKDLDTVEILQ